MPTIKAASAAAKKLKADEAEEAVQRTIRESASGRDSARTTPSQTKEV